MAIDSRTSEDRDEAGGQHDRLRRLGKYGIRKRLGAGGMGTVFLAVDEQLHRTVALKVLPHERAENPTLVKRFNQEAQAAAQLEHKNIVKVYEAGEIDGFLYIALEYVEGIDVHELVVKRGVLPVKRSIDIVRQIARALQHAASKQIVHRDIKPANLIIKRDGTVKLADMGLARSIDDTAETNITRAGMTVGTVDYMSPEQARSSQSADVQSDIYSLGCTWYHMLTGEPPFPEGGLTEKLQAHAAGARPDPRVLNPAVPEAVVAVLHRMMSRSREDRYQTPQELLDDLDLASKSFSSLGASMLDALAGESTATRRQERSRRTGAGGTLPPKERFKPVDLTSGRSIDVDIIRFAIPATLVILVLGVLVWSMRSGGVAISGGTGSAGPANAELDPGIEDADHVDRDAAADQGGAAGRNAVDGEAGADGMTNQITGLSPVPDPAAPPLVVGTEFPGAEDTATTAEGVRLIPDWVRKFRQERSEPVDPIVLTRRPDGSNEFRRLGDALDALPRDGGTITIDGEGPFVLEPVQITSRGAIRVIAAKGRHPVIYLPAGERRGAKDAHMRVRAAQLEIENCHFVMVDPPPGGAVLLKMERGDVSLRNCSITVHEGASLADAAFEGPSLGAPSGDLSLGDPSLGDPSLGDPSLGDPSLGDPSLGHPSLGDRSAPITAIVVGGQGGRTSSVRSRSSAGGSSRCLLENVLCRGDRLTAVELRGESSELVAGNCLISSGSAPAVVLTDGGRSGGGRRNPPKDRDSAPRGLRLLATTLISGRAAVEFAQNEFGRRAAACNVVVRKSLLASRGDSHGAGTEAMVELTGGSDETAGFGSSQAIGVDWSTEDSIYLNWPLLVHLASDTPRSGAETDLISVRTANEWRRFWDKPLKHDTIVEGAQPPPSWNRPASIRPQDVSPKVLARASGSPIDSTAGCDPDDLAGVPLGMIEHVIMASGLPEDPDGIGARMAVDESPRTFDITSGRSLDRFLESDACPDGSHVIVTGFGLRTMNPVEIVDKSLRLEFRSTGGSPLVIHVGRGPRGRASADAAISLRNAAIDLVGAHFKMSAGSNAPPTPSLLQFENAGASVRGCTFEGPATAAGEHAGLIRVADSQERAAAVPRHLLIEDSFLIGPGELLSGPVRWETLILRNSVLVTQGNLLTVHLDESGLRDPSVAVLSHCTFSAGGSVVRLLGQPLPTGDFSPLNMIVTECVFTGPLSGDAAGSAVIAHESESQTRNHVRWWGNANGFADTFGQWVRTGDEADTDADFASDWTAAWGEGHAAHPLFGPTDVIFEHPFPELPKLESAHFALNPTSPAAAWGAEGTPIGADVGGVGVQRKEDSPSPETSPRGTRPGRGAPGGRPNRRNPF